MTPALPDASEQLPVEPEAQESELLLGEHPVEPTLETQDRQAPAPVETGLIASPSAVPADISLEEPAFGHLTPIAGEEPQQPAVQEEEPVTEITAPALSQAEVIADVESQQLVGTTEVHLVTQPVEPAVELTRPIAGDKLNEKSPALRAVPTVAPDEAETTGLPAVGKPDAAHTEMVTGEKPVLGAESQTVGRAS